MGRAQTAQPLPRARPVLGWRHEPNDAPMKKKTSSAAEMRDEYDFSRRMRGKYARRYAEGSNVVVLDPDVAAEFKTPKQVNDALRKVRAQRRKSAAS